MNPDSLRGTGRTTRLITNAHRLAKEGRAVYIVADNQMDARRLQRLVDVDHPEPHGIKVETPASLGSWDWDTLRSVGAHSNCVFLVDHHAIEDRFARVLEMLHRYDSGSPYQSSATTAYAKAPEPALMSNPFQRVLDVADTMRNGGVP